MILGTIYFFPTDLGVYPLRREGDAEDLADLVFIPCLRRF